jgi:hypothetical protein
MKKQVLFIAIVSLFTTLASAADLYVRDFGSGGAYSTISAAITAASDGDRIIIRPKSGGIPYLENLIVNKSLSFVSETNFTKYLIQGTISITPAAGRVITFSNLNLTSSMSVTAATSGGRATLNVFNSILGSDLNALQQNMSLYASGNVLTGGIYLTHGRCTANYCNVISLGASGTETNPATDDVEIIANALNYGADAINLNQRTYNFKVLNNYLTSGYINISGIKTGGSNEIRNNVVNSLSGSTYYPIYVSLSSGNTGFISVLNNILNYTMSSVKIYNTSSGLASVYAFYNMSSTTFSTSGVTSQSSNSVSSSLVLNNTNYTVSGANVNTGYPEDDYADIDLTRNDIGNYGGSNSWANYWPTSVGNKPQIDYLNTPRRIFVGTTTMNATGAGHSK